MKIREDNQQDRGNIKTKKEKKPEQEEHWPI